MRARQRQRGAALLLFATILILGFATLLYHRLGRWADPETTQRKINAEVLRQAKQALIGYVVKEVLDLSNDVPGLFPCPESPGDAGNPANEGRTANFCAPGYATNKNVGRLPWRTLGIDKLVDAAGEPLWYAVSDTWVRKNAPAPNDKPIINTGSPGALRFDGTDDVVAVIIAPGRPLVINPTASQITAGCAARNQSRQDRSHVTGSTTDPDYRDYLECENASSPIDTSFGTSVVDNATNEVSNDQAVVITATEVLNAMQGPLSERLQRTVAPLLSEYADLWVPGSKVLPYAVPFSPPEAALAANAHCGAGTQMEGLLPVAPNTVSCDSTWVGPTVTGGSDIVPVSCTPGSPVVCTFRYYRFTATVLGLLGITTATSVTATVQATAPHAAASFRDPLALTDFSFTSGSGSFSNLSYTPKTNGDVDMSVDATVTGLGVCRNGLISGLVCSLVALLGGATQQDISIQFPQLPTSVVLTGSKLSPTVRNGGASFDLLNPGSNDPHYWFMRNEWYRYTYYAVAPNTSAAQSGGNITVSGFPATNGAPDDKHFVLALMGPVVTGQSRPGATFDQYVEGQNAISTSPRTFAYLVYSAPGNDRIATCPFNDGVAPCD